MTDSFDGLTGAIRDDEPVESPQQRLREAAEAAGGWWVWCDKTGDKRFAPMAEWLETWDRYEAGVVKRAKRPESDAAKGWTPGPDQ